MNEIQLVSFGNYLLKKYKVKKQHKKERIDREVSDADLENWKELNPLQTAEFVIIDFSK